MNTYRITSKSKAAERRLSNAVAGSERPSRRRRVVFDQASQLGLKSVKRDVDYLDRAAMDASHPIKHKFVSNKRVADTQAHLARTAAQASRRRAWADRDRGALFLRGFANVLLNLVLAAAILGAALYWIGAI